MGNTGKIIFVTIIAVILGIITFVVGTKSGSAPDVDKTTYEKKITITDSDHIRGTKDATITFVEYSDFQCPYCAKFYLTMKQLLAEYPTQVRWVLREYPLTFHQYARTAAFAAEAAGEQDKYWEYADILAEKSQPDGSTFTDSDLENYANQLGLDIVKFKQDLSNAKISEKISADMQTADDLKIEGTPTLYMIKGDKMTAIPANELVYQTLKQKIEESLQ